jgi:nicotinate phosphoribosyltransferase
MPDATVTDLYEVTMAMSYLREGMTAPATFSLFVRRLPPDRGFLVAAGLDSVLDHLTDFRVTAEDTRVFAQVLGRSPEETAVLEGLRFTGEVRAVPEGRIVFAGEPLLEVTAPLPVAQLVESYVLNQVSHQTAVASKAARCVLAAAGRPVVDFSLRRTHGAEAACQAARTGALVGFAGTSNVAAAAAWHFPAVGTMAHSYVQAFDYEEEAFRAFLRTHPGPVTLLVDTYDTERGVHTAARVLRDAGPAAGSAIRLDSGDLGSLARRARRILDDWNLPQVRIVASGGLDEHAIHELRRSGAPVDTFAVGTKVGVSADAPYLDSAYKLVEYDGHPVMKLSAAKVTAPGRKQVFRRRDEADVIALREEEPPPGGEPLLETVARHGERLHAGLPLVEGRARYRRDVSALPVSALRIRAPEPLVPATSAQLADLTRRVRARLAAEAVPTGRYDGGIGVVRGGRP